MNIALTVAGSDSSGGAGVYADIKTFSAFNVHGASVITAVTAQNSIGIKSSYSLPVIEVENQLESLLEDMTINATKTGMLANDKIIAVVATKLSEINMPIIVDPIIKAESGFHLLNHKGISALKRNLIPKAFLVTPNIPEAELLTDMKIKTVSDIKKAAKYIVDNIGCENVIIKGGHFNSTYAIDILYHKNRYHEFKGKRIKGNIHGTGCSFSAAITANLAKGVNLPKSVDYAKEFIENAIRYSYSTGKGIAPVNPFGMMYKNGTKWDVLNKLQNSLLMLSTINISSCIPEVGMNIAYSLPKPFVSTPDDIAAVDGRITRTLTDIRFGEVKFGASRHLSQALIKIAEIDSSIRAVMNIKFDEKIISKASESFSLASYDRTNEPSETRKREGHTISWGISEALKNKKTAPDIIFHRGDIGKEPMILIFGKNPEDVIAKLSQLLPTKIK